MGIATTLRVGGMVSGRFVMFRSLGGWKLKYLPNVLEKTEIAVETG